MEFGRHIGKGVWAFADKALPAFYGVAFIFLVIRVLPEREYGSFALIQAMFAIVSSLGFALAVQPLVKFSAETEEYGPYVVAAISLKAVFYVLVSIVILILREPIAMALDSTQPESLAKLINYVPVLLMTALYRSIAIGLLQAKYRIQRIFWIDSVYFVGSVVLVVIAQSLGRFSTAEDLLMLSIVAQVSSSILGGILTKEVMSIRLDFRWEKLIEMWRFGRYTFGGNSLYAVFAQADAVIVSAFTGVVGVAVYNASKILIRIFEMVGQVLQMFLIPFASKQSRTGERDELRVVAEKSVCFSTLSLLPFFLVMVLIPEQVLSLLYGGKYEHGSTIVRVFGFLALVLPLNAALVSIIIGLGKAKESFVFSLVLVVIGGTAYIILTPIFGLIGTSLAYVGSFLIITTVMFKYVQRFIPFTMKLIVSRVRDLWTFFRLKMLTR